jgi:hypothetical protein
MVSSAISSVMKSSTKRRAKTALCETCRTRFKVPSRGRLPTFCSSACRQRAYDKRKWGRPRPVELLAADLAHAKVRDWLRREIWGLLVQAGLVPRNSPPPALPRTKKPKLTVVGAQAGPAREAPSGAPIPNWPPSL